MYADHHRAILAYALRRMGTDDAYDVVAETFLVAWRRIDDVPEGDAVLPWLYGVARRILANTRRGIRRRKSLESRLVEHSPSWSVSAVAISHTGDPAIREAMNRLKPSDQEILRLTAWEGLSPKQLASVLGCSANAAAVRLHRARRRLASALRAIERRAKGGEN